VNARPITVPLGTGKGCARTRSDPEHVCTALSGCSSLWHNSIGHGCVDTSHDQHWLAGGSGLGNNSTGHGLASWAALVEPWPPWRTALLLTFGAPFLAHMVSLKLRSDVQPSHSLHNRATITDLTRVEVPVDAQGRQWKVLCTVCQWVSARNLCANANHTFSVSARTKRMLTQLAMTIDFR